jgi:hypothetical protein
MRRIILQLVIVIWTVVTAGQHIAVEAQPLIGYDAASDEHCISAVGRELDTSKGAPVEPADEALHHHHHCPAAITPSTAGAGAFIAINILKQRPHSQTPLLSRGLAPPLDPPLA